MGTCYPFTLFPMTAETVSGKGVTVEIREKTWLGFPKEVEEKLEVILKPYGYEPDSDEAKAPGADTFLLYVEQMFEEGGRVPWAIIFYPEEYPEAVGEHLLSIRPNRDMRYSGYSCFPSFTAEPRTPVNEDRPPLSIIFAFSKSALMASAASNSPLLRDALTLLADKPESENWVVIADSLDPAEVQAICSNGLDVMSTSGIQWSVSEIVPIP